MNQGPSSPPGWYPTPDGHQRYWDGGQWLAIPPPEPGPGPSKRRRTIVLFVATLVLAAIVGGGLALLLEQRDARRPSKAPPRLPDVKKQRKRTQRGSGATMSSRRSRPLSRPWPTAISRMA